MFSPALWLSASRTSLTESSRPCSSAVGGSLLGSAVKTNTRGAGDEEDCAAMPAPAMNASARMAVNDFSMTSALADEKSSRMQSDLSRRAWQHVIYPLAASAARGVTTPSGRASAYEEAEMACLCCRFPIAIQPGSPGGDRKPPQHGSARLHP